MSARFRRRGRDEPDAKQGQSPQTTPHAEIKAALKPEMETSRFITFDVTDEDIPLSVDAESCPATA